ncbi:hypothetical protein HUN59_05245 [Curtobacterium sp. Csp2]|uniref:hypothetical protein n=1 Tax=Curtobacterium sp. Csp2 TaxID=2495430 RepID=UPI0015806E62|nr:hypothetical protein [Curtobacterium sp. Csp2]QKS15702.1 hypothetical protein HUN59_05245 [Curtobacterium sp. Csp2]
MALVSIKNGTVNRLNQSGFGFSVIEQNESNGKTYRSYYKIWPKEDAGVSIGDIVNVSGFLSVKVNEPNQEGKVYADVSLNSPRIERVGSVPQNAQQPVSAPNTAPQPQWDTQATNGAQTGAQGSWQTAGQIADAEVPW